MGYERNNILQLDGYVPGEQPEQTDVVKLNTNENPYPPCDAVMQALAGIEPEALRRYPSPTARSFRETAARHHGLTPDEVIATNGGDELLRLAMTTFVEPGEPIGVAEPSYSLYPVLAAIHDSPVFRVPLDENWALPADFAQRMNDAGVRLCLIVNPHAPSGRLEDAANLEALAATLNGVLLIDEAYVDFVDPALGYETVPLVRTYDNVLILRSFSKGYSLAGLRFGYGLGPRSLIDPMLTKVKDSYNKDVVGQRLAQAALENSAAASRSWRMVREQRARVSDALAPLGLRCPPSQSNFLLATVTGRNGIDAEGLYEALKARGILVRYFDADRLRDKLRITVGTPEENEALIGALRALLD